MKFLKWTQSIRAGFRSMKLQHKFAASYLLVCLIPVFQVQGLSNVTDNNLTTNWSGKSSYLRLDLGSVKQVARVDISFYQGDQNKYVFTILGSKDATERKARKEGGLSGRQYT